MTDAALARIERSESYIVGVDDAISPKRLLEQVTLIQEVMREVMHDGEHYGIIPGTGKKCPDCRGQNAACPKCKGTGIIGKPSLLKPGAEKLCFTFRMDPEFDVEILPIQHKIPGHREYRIKCTLFSINSGQRLGSGVGSASTMESKWRFRTGPKELTDKIVPKEYWDNRDTDPKKAQESIGGKGFSVAKGDDKKWYIAIQGEKVENDNPADVYNTVLKVGKKRSLVDAVLTCTAASDCFTQDIEDLVDNGVIVTTAVTPPQTAGKVEAAVVDPVGPSPAVETQTPPPPAGTHTAPLLHLDAEKDVPHELTQSEVKDEIAIACGKIANMTGTDAGTVLYSLTVNAKGKYGTRDINALMWEASGPKGPWSPLKSVLSKAKKELEKMALKPSSLDEERDDDVL